MTTGLSTLRLLLHLPDGSRRSVGHLSRFGDVLRVGFDAAYVEDPERPTLSLTYRGATEDDTRRILRADRDERVVRRDGRWPAFFQNLLPEGPNRERLARERGCDVDDELQLLAAAGHDLFGAVEVEPVSAAEGVPEAVRLWHTTLGAEAIAAEPVAAPLEDGASLPGVVTKFSAVREGRRYVVRRQGKAGSFILKLPSTRHPDLVENELCGYRLAQSLGLRCAEATRVARRDVDLPESVPFEQVLAVTRFDRTADGRRVHMEEMAQALGYEPRRKYGRGLEIDFPRMLRVLDALAADPTADVSEAVRRLVAFALMGNTDAHLKNWALLYPDGVTPVLAPLYDPVCVAAWFDELPPAEYALNRRIDATLRALDRDALAGLLREAGLPRVSRLLTIARDTVAAAHAEWPRILRDAPANVAASVTARLAGGVALARW